MSRSLRVNPIACEAHGMCVELLPELITADPWGYPIIAPGPVPGHLLAAGPARGRCLPDPGPAAQPGQ